MTIIKKITKKDLKDIYNKTFIKTKRKDYKYERENKKNF